MGIRRARHVGDRSRWLACAVAAALIALTSSAPFAQSVNPPEGATPAANLTLEQRHMIKELVKDLKVPPVTADAPASIGATVPESIVAQPVPVEVAQRVPQIRSHAFFVKDDRIVLVNPKDRKITDVID